MQREVAAEHVEPTISRIRAINNLWVKSGRCRCIDVIEVLAEAVPDSSVDGRVDEPHVPIAGEQELVVTDF